MIDELRGRAAGFLGGHHWGVLSAPVPAGRAGRVTWAVPARYCPIPRDAGKETLAVDCLVPRWADLDYLLGANPQALLVVPDMESSWLRWLEYHGTAQSVEPDRSAFAGVPGLQLDGRYLAIRILPLRIDLIDESRGWGARETVEF